MAVPHGGSGYVSPSCGVGAGQVQVVAHFYVAYTGSAVMQVAARYNAQQYRCGCRCDVVVICPCWPLARALVTLWVVAAPAVLELGQR